MNDDSYQPDEVERDLADVRAQIARCWGAPQLRVRWFTPPPSLRERSRDRRVRRRS